MVAIFALGYSMTAQTASLAQKSVEITNFKASYENTDLLVKWTSLLDANYWEVQGSADGKSYTTIGMVMGTDPKGTGSYTFKQKIQKIKPGLIYFRVLHIENDAATEIAGLSGEVK